MSDYKELRAQAKALGINTFQMSKTAILEAMAAAKSAGVEPVQEKKGKPSWRWRNRLDVANKAPGFRYRFCDKDETNLRNRMEDGWQFVNRSTGVPGEHIDPRQVADGKPLEGAFTYRDLVLMALPEEIAAERDAAVRERTRQQTVGLKQALQRDLRNAGGPTAEATGSITIIE